MWRNGPWKFLWCSAPILEEVYWWYLYCPSEQKVEHLQYHFSGIEGSIQFTAELKFEGCHPFLDLHITEQMVQYAHPFTERRQRNKCILPTIPSHIWYLLWECGLDILQLWPVVWRPLWNGMGTQSPGVPLHHQLYETDINYSSTVHVNIQGLCESLRCILVSFS